MALRTGLPELPDPEKDAVSDPSFSDKRESPAYFARVTTLRRIAVVAPQLLRLPWRYMRRMGVLELRLPSQTVYTFLTHQWEAREEPQLRTVAHRPPRSDFSRRLGWAFWACLLGGAFRVHSRRCVR